MSKMIENGNFIQTVIFKTETLIFSKIAYNFLAAHFIKKLYSFKTAKPHFSEKSKWDFRS